MMALLRAFFSMKNCGKKASLSQIQKIMLGGRYKILDVKRASARTSYKLLASSNGDDEFFEGLDLRKAESIQTCPFERGELVKFHPSCGEAEVNYLLHLFDSYLELSNPRRFYRVSRILNEYYIFIEDFKGSQIHYPFRWEDFREY